MPFRQKLKKTFGSKKNGSGSDESSNSGTWSPQRTDIEYYKPNEIPKSKYRGKPDPEVVGKFEAYSFTDAFQTVRRKSSQALSGTFSPGGTQAQSRRASWMSRTKSSLSTTSVGSDTDGAELRRKSVASVGAPKEADLEETEEDDTANASTVVSESASRSDVNAKLDLQDDGAELVQEKTVTAARPTSSTYTPFTAEDLERAMTKATLRPRTGTVVPAVPMVQPAPIAA